MNQAMSEYPASPETDLTTDDSQQIEALEKSHRNGSGWFFWIAVLSLVNSAIILSGSDWSFLIGLGITQIIDAIAMAIGKEFGNEGLMIGIAFVFDAFVAGSFMLWGVLARKNFLWAYIIGMILYALDGLLFLLVQDIPSFGFHLFALFWLFNGLKACRKLKQLSPHAPTVESTLDESTTEAGFDS